MSVPAGPGRGPVGVVTAVSGGTESTVAVALSGRRDLALVRRCADVAELLSVAEVGLAAVAVVNEAFAGIDADVVDRLRRAGLAVIGVVDPDRESSERLRAWGVPVVDVPSGPGPHDGEEALAAAVAAAGARQGAGGLGSTGGGPVVGAGVRPGSGDGDGTGPDDGTGPGGGTSPGDGTGGRDDEEDGGTGSEDARAGSRSTADPAGGARGAAAAPGPGVGQVSHDGLDGHDSHDSHDGRDDLDRLDGPAGHVPRTPARARVVAVWGPAGAPGRTTVAVGLAAELADAGSEVLLVDADTYAASVAQVLGLLDESPGLVAAVRAGLDGRLDPTVLARLAPLASPRLRVLTGIVRAARWSELRPAGLEAVLTAGRALVDVVVVDLAPPVEEDEELSYDTAAPRRNGAALDVLRAADDVVVVGSADPVGLQRLVRALQDLAAAVPSAAPVVVVNKVRADAVGRNPSVRVTEALERFAGVRVRHLVPDDRAATDRALLAGRTLLEQAPDSPARAALRDLAASLVPGAAAEARRGGRRSASRGPAGGVRRRATRG